MQRIIQDPDLLAQLQQLTHEVEFRDPSGKLLGYFLPPDRHRELFELWTNSPVTPEELDCARKQTGGYTLAEIWNRFISN